MNRSIKIIVAAGLGLSLMCSMPMAGAAAKKGANADKPTAKVAGKVSITGVQQFAMAQELVKYGRKKKSPEALITAAEILGKAKVKPITGKSASVKPAFAVESKGEKKVAKPGGADPMALLDEAKTMSGNDPGIAALADKVATTIGVSRGAGHKLAADKVLAHDTDAYKITFEGGETAQVVVSGDGDTDLDLFVYDQNGNLVVSDTDTGDDCLVEWKPVWTGPFTVKVKNLGGVYNEYVLVTN